MFAMSTNPFFHRDWSFAFKQTKGRSLVIGKEANVYNNFEPCDTYLSLCNCKTQLLGKEAEEAVLVSYIEERFRNLKPSVSACYLVSTKARPKCRILTPL